MSDSIDGLKQRLVGAFVILTLAIIFLPMIFDKPHVIGNSTIMPVPSRPDFQTVVVTKPERPAFDVVEVDPNTKKLKLAENKTEQVAAVPAVAPEKSERKEDLAAPQVREEPKPATRVAELEVFKNVWMVQLGTFSDSDNAYRLRDRLRNDGFKSHTKPLDIKGKKAIRVFSGPFVSKNEAQKIKKKLDARYKVDSLVLFFDP